MKTKLLLTASGLALGVGLIAIVMFMEMYDVKPSTWGPRGVEFEVWHGAWRARRDSYVMLGTGSFCAAAAFCAAGLFLHHQTKGIKPTRRVQVSQRH